MKKIYSLLLATAICISTLTACGEKSAGELTPLMQQATAVAAAAQPVQRDYSHYTPITDKAEISELTFFMDSVTGVPIFPEIRLISKEWLVKRFFLTTDDSFCDATLYNTYNKDSFTKLSSIERLAQEQINPDIQMNADDRFYAFDGSNIFTPLWIPEEEVFGWYGFGGNFGFYKSHPIEMVQDGTRYYVKSIDMYLSYAEEYFIEEELPYGSVLVQSVTDSEAWLEAGTFTNHEGTMHYSITANEDELQQSWYELEKMPSGDFRLLSKSPANWQKENLIHVSVDYTQIQTDLAVVHQDGIMYVPFYQLVDICGLADLAAEVPQEVLMEIGEVMYLDVESALYLMGARMSFHEEENTYYIHARDRVESNAFRVGNYLMELVSKGKAEIVYRPTLVENGTSQQFTVVSILNNGYLEVHDDTPMLMEGSGNETPQKNRMFGYFLGAYNQIVTDPVQLMQLQTITLANAEYQLFRDGLILTGDNQWFWEEPKNQLYSDAALLKKWEKCIDKAYQAIVHNAKSLTPLTDFLESVASTLLSNTLSPKTGVYSLCEKTVKDIIMNTAIKKGIESKLTPVMHDQIKPSDMVYHTAIYEYELHHTYRDSMHRIVDSTQQGYINTYDDACVFLQGFYQMNASMSALRRACQVQLALIPESKKDIEAALINLTGSLVEDKVLSVVIPATFDIPVGSETCDIIKDILTSTADVVKEDYKQESIQGYIQAMAAEIKNEKMKLQYALYTNPKDTISYAIINY